MTSTAQNRLPARVLIVDRSEDSRDVLRTILEHRGVHILEAEQADEGLELLREQQPSLVVLDLEIAPGDPAGLQGKFEDESRRSDTPLVMLGRVRRGSQTGNVGKTPDLQHIVGKPYHYGPLVRTIEQLLRQHESVT